MARNKTAQGGISLRSRVTAWLAAILLVTMLSTGIATMAGQWTVHSFDTLLADNAVCYTVQNALKDEAQAFARYVRQPTSETEQAYTAACAAAEQSLAALPFDYARIGEERYARTWNLLQGYAGYRQERDAFLQLSPSADTYIEQMYHVMALQDYLAEYALRLTQATLEQENTLYSSTATRLRHLQRTTREKLLSYLSAESIRQSSLSFDIPFDRQQLADFLCVERAAMSVELSKLQKEGLLVTKRNHFELLTR